MVETLELDRSRESEIMAAIKSKLSDLEHANTNSSPNSPGRTQKILHIPSRANTQPPTSNSHFDHHNVTENRPYSEPNTAKEANASNANPFHSEPETTPKQFEQTHFPKVFNSNGTAANIQSISNAAKSKANTQSAPVTPGHSPQSEKKNGYHSETETNAETMAPKLVSDSLLDQIMALPRETIKARIIQFGGTFHDDDQTGFLVTKLFQLLSSSNQSKRLNDDEIDSSSTLIMGHKTMNNSMIASNAQSAHATPPNNSNNIQQQQQQRPLSSSKKASISPPNDLAYPPIMHTMHTRQSSQESLKSVSPKSHHTMSTLSPRSSHNRSASNQSKEAAMPTIVDDDDDDDDDNELDPNVELPKLRIRQKELMKDKIRFEVQRLKQRTDNRLGRDMTVDDIASELAQVEKQIKVLTDASKSGAKKIKIKKIQKTESSFPFSLSGGDRDKKLQREASFPKLNISEIAKEKEVISRNDTSRRNSIEPSEHLVAAASGYHSRNNSNESNQELAITSHNVSVVGSASNSASHSASFLIEPQQCPIGLVSSPLVSSTHRDEFEIHLKCLPNKLDLSDIHGIDFLFNPAPKNVSFGVLQNAKERVKREEKQLEEEYKQYFADQTEMLLLKLSKHRQNKKKRASETQSTQNKLRQKLDKQRNKFQSIVNDQLQILQLTQELNDEPVPVGVPNDADLFKCDEYYLYKEEVDKNYILRVQEFEAKQKKELDAFRTDLHALKQLKLEIKKKNVSASRSNTSSPNRSPAKNAKSSGGNSHHHHHQHQQHHNGNNDHLGALTLAAPQQSSKRSKRKKQHPGHSQSATTVPIQIDMLTGDNNADCACEQEIIRRPPLHKHSSSLPSIPLIDNAKDCIPSKFKLTHQQQQQQQHKSIKHRHPHPHSPLPNMQILHHKVANLKGSHHQLSNQDVDKMTNQINTSLNDLNNISNNNK